MEPTCRKGKGSLAEILGIEEKDVLAKVNFKITRYNDLLTANSAAVMDIVESSNAAERLREDVRNTMPNNPIPYDSL